MNQYAPNISAVECYLNEKLTYLTQFLVTWSYTVFSTQPLPHSVPRMDMLRGLTRIVIEAVVCRSPTALLQKFEGVQWMKKWIAGRERIVSWLQHLWMLFYRFWNFHHLCHRIPLWQVSETRLVTGDQYLHFLQGSDLIKCWELCLNLGSSM